MPGHADFVATRVSECFHTLGHMPLDKSLDTSSDLRTNVKPLYRMLMRQKKNPTIAVVSRP